MCRGLRVIYLPRVSVLKMGLDTEDSAGSQRMVEPCGMDSHQVPRSLSVRPGIEKEATGLGHALEQDNAWNDRIAGEMPLEIGLFGTKTPPGSDLPTCGFDLRPIDKQERRALRHERQNRFGFQRLPA
jgi:hypothetical protein